MPDEWRQRFTTTQLRKIDALRRLMDTLKQAFIVAGRETPKPADYMAEIVRTDRKIDKRLRRLTKTPKGSPLPWKPPIGYGDGNGE